MKKWAVVSACVMAAWYAIIFTVGVPWWGIFLSIPIGASFGWSTVRAVGQHGLEKRRREAQRFFDMMQLSESEMQRWREQASLFNDAYRWKPDDDDSGPDAA